VDGHFWVCHPCYPAGGDERLTAAQLIGVHQMQLQLPVALTRRVASLQPGYVHLCLSVALQQQSYDKILNMGLVGAFNVPLNPKYQ
jgi:hypothetical protein